MQFIIIIMIYILKIEYTLVINKKQNEIIRGARENLSPKNKIGENNDKKSSSY